MPESLYRDCVTREGEMSLALQPFGGPEVFRAAGILRRLEICPIATAHSHFCRKGTNRIEVHLSRQVCSSWSDYVDDSGGIGVHWR